MARRENCRDIGTTASAVAGSEKYRTADNGDCRPLCGDRLLFCRRLARHHGASADERPVDRLCDDGLCGAAHAYAGDEKPRAMAWLHLRSGRGLRLGAFGGRPAWTGGRRLRASPALPAQPAPARSELLKTETSLQ